MPKLANGRYVAAVALAVALLAVVPEAEPVEDTRPAVQEPEKSAGT